MVTIHMIDVRNRKKTILEHSLKKSDKNTNGETDSRMKREREMKGKERKGKEVGARPSFKHGGTHD